MTAFKAMDSMISLSTLGALEVAGADAGIFLQGQMTRDVVSVSEDFALTGFCTPQGKLYATPRIARHEAGFLLILPRAQSEAFAQRLSRYVLRSKVTINMRSDLMVFTSAQKDGGVLEVDSGLVLGGRDEAAFWEAQVRSAQPWIFSQTEGLFVPQALDFDRFEAVSYTKGCYTGQEIVGRIHWQGKVSKHLCAFSADGVLDVLPGQTLQDECGEPVATVLYASGQSLLAVLDAGGRNPICTQQGTRVVPFSQ